MQTCSRNKFVIQNFRLKFGSIGFYRLLFIIVREFEFIESEFEFIESEFEFIESEFELVVEPPFEFIIVPEFEFIIIPELELLSFFCFLTFTFLLPFVIPLLRSWFSVALVLCCVNDIPIIVKTDVKTKPINTFSIFFILLLLTILY